MPTVYQTPGVYINEVSSGNRPIEGVATSVAAFVGLAPGGPVNTPKKVTSWIEFARTFGDETPNSTNGPYMDNAYLAHAVQGFFANGGTICYVVRVGTNLHGGVPLLEIENKDGDAAYTLVRRPQDSDVDPEKHQLKPVSDWEPVKLEFAKIDPGDPAAVVDADAKEGAATPAPVEPAQFDVTITLGDGEPPAGLLPGEDNPKVETFRGLSATPGGKFFASVLNTKSRLVSVEDPDQTPPFSQRIFDIPTSTMTLEPTDAAAPKVTSEKLEGDAVKKTGLGALDGIDEITMVCVPDLVAVTNDPDQISALQQKVEQYCIKGKRMAILDPPPALDKQEIATWRQGINTGSAFSTLYWPWLRVMDPISKAVIEIPPSGHVAGVWAGTDARRGVHKAPANEVVSGIVGVASEVSNPDQEALNPIGINVIRQFPGRGVRIWGARTLATKTDPEWRYINVRRLFNYVSASILEGTNWAVFEPNDQVLWGSLRVSVSNFLMGVWRSGALFGASPDEAFFVKCDRDTNPQDAIDAGQVNIHIGIAPVKPAEFVVFQISQYVPVSA